MRAPRYMRERGTQDLRMLAPTVCMWATMLAMRAIIELPSKPILQYMNRTVLACIALFAVGISVIVWAVCTWRTRIIYVLMSSTCLTLCIGSCVLGALSMVTQWSLTTSDVLMQATSQGTAIGVFHVRATAPAMRSSSYTADCTVTSDIEQVVFNHVVSTSHMSASIQLNEPYCEQIMQGARYEFSGTVQRAAWDNSQLQVNVDSTIVMNNDPALWWRGIEHVRQRFYAVTRQLDDQGRVLVPGVTLGVLGQDIVMRSQSSSSGTSVDETYAQRLEERCKAAGIIHVMAVSGGHYALLARACVLVTSWMCAPRWVRAVLQLMAYGGLTMVLVPSESVTRALYMGIFCIGYVLCGRRSQTMHALCWTTMIALLIEPMRATNYAFSLSCMSVLGIALCMNPLQEKLVAWFPQWCAQALAMTISAQLCTLPVQILMDSSVPLLSIPANLLVAPTTDIATICGLIACALSVVLPHISWCCATIASWGTRPIEIAADLFGSQEAGSMPWASGIQGALLMCLVESVICALVIASTYWIRSASVVIHKQQEIGSKTVQQPVLFIQQWWQDTITLFTTLYWSKPHHDRKNQ